MIWVWYFMRQLYSDKEGKFLKEMIKINVECIFQFFEDYYYILF